MQGWRVGALFVAATVSTSVFATDYYVKEDGDDALDGTTLETARATIAGGLALLEGQGGRLLVDEGTYAVPATIVLSGNSSMVSLRGAGKATLKTAAAVRVFDLQGAESTVDGFLVDFDKKDYKGLTTGGLAKDFCGRLLNCTFVNYYTADSGDDQAMVCFSADVGTTPVISNCTFRSCLMTRKGCVIDSTGAGLRLLDCKFIDCTTSPGCASRGIVLLRTGVAAPLMRNCLFLRCACLNPESADGESCLILAGDNVEVSNCTIVDCSVLDTLSKGWLKSTGAPFRNCLVQNCRDGAGNPLSFGGPYDHCAADVTLSGAGNVLTAGTDFRLRCPAEDDCRVVEGPTIDAGLDQDWMAGAGDADGRHHRIIGSAVDIGCYERDPNEGHHTYYVAATGDDAKDGRTPETAKATIGAGMALLAEFEDRLVVGPGTYDISETIALKDGWSLAGKAGQTTIKLAVHNISMASVADSGSFIDGVTFNFDLLYKREQAERYPTVDGFPDLRGKLSNCVITNFLSGPSAATGRSTIIVTSSGGRPVISNCTFSSCLSSFGVSKLIDSNGAPFKLLDCKFVDCTCRSYKLTSKVSIRGASVSDWAQIRNCLLLRCTHREMDSTVVKGACFIQADANTDVSNVSLVDCSYVTGTIASPGSALGGGATFYNCLIQNFRDAGGNPRSCGSDLRYCAADQALTGEGCIDTRETDFRFRDPEKGDYRVAAGPTIDAGTNQVWMAGAKDLGGVVDRIVSGRVDIGCYEFRSPGLLLMLR